MSAPKVNLELQLKFLNQLQSAVTDALGRFEDQDDNKLAELQYMEREVRRAQRMVNERMDEKIVQKPRAARRYDSTDDVRQTAAL